MRNDDGRAKLHLDGDRAKESGNYHEQNGEQRRTKDPTASVHTSLTPLAPRDNEQRDDRD